MGELCRQYLSRQRHRCVYLKHLLLSALEYCWVLIVVLNGNTVYNANAIRQYYLLPLSVVMTVLLLIAHLVFSRMRIKKRNMLLAVSLCQYSMIYFVVRQNSMEATNYFYLFIAGLPCLFLLFTELNRQGKLIGLFCKIGNVICILAAVSLFFWGFGTVLNKIQPNMSTRINWGNFAQINGYWGLHFEIQRDTTFRTLMYRNSGIFAEAPMLNLWVDIALAIELFLREKTSKCRVTIFVLTILTTMSTTGIIFIALCIVLKYFRALKKMNRLAKGLLLLASIVVIPVIIYMIYSVLVLKSGTVSFAMRMSDYVGPLELWMKYPIFGSGYANLKSLAAYIYSPSGTLGFSNSIMAVLSTGGLWMAVPFYYAHIVSMFQRMTKSKQISQFSICYFFLFCTTAFFARYIAVVMVAFHLAVLMEAKHDKLALKSTLRDCRRGVSRSGC